MKARSIRSALRICMVATLAFSAFSGSAAQPATTNTGPTLRAQAVDRNSVAREILDAWGDYLIPVDAENNSPYGPFDLRRALRRATPEQLLDARNAKTFDDVVAALPRTTGGGVVPRALAVGERIPLVLGDTTDDLVYTPVTPCRIIDTRVSSAPYTKPASNAGHSFYVTLASHTDYIAEGGSPTSCGIPSNPKPSAVAVNLTSALSTTSGYLTINPSTFPPTTSLLNYTATINIANAAIVNSNTNAGDEIFIYNGSGSTDIVVDIMGYFTPPAATPLDSQVLETVATVPVNNFTVFSPPCPAGFILTGGGLKSDVYHYISYFASSAPDATTTPAFNGWVCQGTANTPVDVHCYAICARVPGH